MIRVELKVAKIRPYSKIEAYFSEFQLFVVVKKAAISNKREPRAMKRKSLTIRPKKKYLASKPPKIPMRTCITLKA